MTRENLTRSFLSVYPSVTTYLPVGRIEGVKTGTTVKQTITCWGSYMGSPMCPPFLSGKKEIRASMLATMMKTDRLGAGNNTHLVLWEGEEKREREREREKGQRVGLGREFGGSLFEISLTHFREHDTSGKMRMRYLATYKCEICQLCIVLN